jgi:hypothetical protein
MFPPEPSRTWIAARRGGVAKKGSARTLPDGRLSKTRKNDLKRIAVRGFLKRTLVAGDYVAAPTKGDKSGRDHGSNGCDDGAFHAV